MPQTKVVLFREADGSVPLLEWLDGLPKKSQSKCLAGIQRLRALGHELRRPEADYLRDGIYELRVRTGNVNYRILYFFHGTQALVISHGIKKERVVPPAEIERTIQRRATFLKNPKLHTYEE